MSQIDSVLIANRGEIAIRIARACADLGWRSVSVYAEDDASSRHVTEADWSVALDGRGPAAYLDMEGLIAAAKAQGCQAIHPGYGFLSESAAFAQRCADHGLTFIGPTPSVLDALGDKAKARALAVQCGVPLLPGLNHAVTLEEARAFQQEYGVVMLKALAGGGGRGMRVVHQAEALADAFERCTGEAQMAFGSAGLYVEKWLGEARHIEVQVLGDGQHVTHLWERDCSLQRRHQKLVEIAPAQGLSETLRAALIDASLTLASALKYRGLGTFEFLVSGEAFWFMEANPRLQVEHTITEQVTGVDLVQTQLQLAAGVTLEQLNLLAPVPPTSCAIELRVNLERMAEDGSTRPASGGVTVYAPPSGPGIRVDDCGYVGLRAHAGYDALIAKVIVQGRDWSSTLRRAYRAACEFHIAGAENSLPLLRNVLSSPALATAPADTRFIERHLTELLAPREHAGVRVLTREVDETHGSSETGIPDGRVALRAEGAGTVVALLVSPGDSVALGSPIAVLEAMKMEFEIKATASGVIDALRVAVGDVLDEGAVIALLTPAEVQAQVGQTEEVLDLEAIRPDLAKVLARHAQLMDDARPAAVARRRKTGQRTARENLEDLLDPGSFIEYGAMALAARRRRHSVEELIEASPADGLIAGMGTVNAAQFGEEAARCVAMSYDYTVFAGTQGVMNHKKTDRLLAVANQWHSPLVYFAEGGGGRPGDTDFVGVAGLDCHTFVAMADLSGRVPMVGVVSGRCFAGNAALLGCCDVIIAAKDASIGMAGPAMIEGGGLGRFAPDEVGPTRVQSPNGVIDVLVEDEAEAVAVAKQYLSYVQGVSRQWRCADQRVLRHVIPENRLRVYDMRTVIRLLADEDSVLELRRAFAPGLITAFVRIEGKPFGLMANNPAHLGGAIDAVSGDKAARFMRLCESYGLPIISLCDTPGFMVGPEAEKQATVRHVSRMFVTAASLSVPFFTVVLRKGYGLGAQAMAAGSFHSPVFTAAWPSAEFGAMGIEGAVRLGFSRELAAQESDEAREALFRKLVAKGYESGQALNMASYLEIDAVIDPEQTRRWLLRGLNTAGGAPKRGDGVRRFIDTW